MPDILIRNVTQEIVAALKSRAELNRRSLQQELLEILEDAAINKEFLGCNLAEEIRERLAAYGQGYSDSTQQIRADRDR